MCVLRCVCVEVAAQGVEVCVCVEVVEVCVEVAAQGVEVCVCVEVYMYVFFRWLRCICMC